MLGGVEIDAPGLLGHSDADVVAHAVADALLGAAGLPDLGTLFPETDEQYRGASSIGCCDTSPPRSPPAAGRSATSTSWSRRNDPRLAPHVDAMARNLQRALVALLPRPGVPAPVSVKPKRGEGLGAVGRGEGIAAWAVALLEPGRLDDPGLRHPAREKVELVLRDAGQGVDLRLRPDRLRRAPRRPRAGRPRFDIVRRYLEWRGLEVTFVSNVTDVEDKIIARRPQRGAPSRRSRPSTRRPTGSSSTAPASADPTTSRTRPRTSPRCSG